MKLRDHLNEKYYDLVKHYGFGWKNQPPITIFVNPTSSEIKELPHEVRFVADKKKKEVYVWDADVIHSEALPSKIIDPPTAFTGTAKKVGNKLVMFYSDQLNYMVSTGSHNTDEIYMKWLKERSWVWKDNLNWLNKYVDTSQWIKITKPRFEKKMEQA